MNPGKALSSWVSEPLIDDPKASSTEHALQVWSKATGQSLSSEAQIVGRGVRDLLGLVFGYLSQSEYEVWLPEDVYPIYWGLAGDEHLQALAFSSLNVQEWDFLKAAGRRAAALLPIPLMPAGRWPTRSEIDCLVAWLRESSDRILIVDAAYTYDFRACANTLDPLLKLDQCVALFSCSKSWLLPDALGIARVPSRWSGWMRAGVPTTSTDGLALAVSRLLSHPELPSRQENVFQREWGRLSALIHSAVPGWRSPQTGYFSTVAVSYKTLLKEHNILSIPASVFGAKRDGLSVLTCLHDIAAWERP
jgi:hypothetical protein